MYKKNLLPPSSALEMQAADSFETLVPIPKTISADKTGGGRCKSVHITENRRSGRGPAALLCFKAFLYFSVVSLSGDCVS